MSWRVSIYECNPGITDEPEVRVYSPASGPNPAVVAYAIYGGIVAVFAGCGALSWALLVGGRP